MRTLIEIASDVRSIVERAVKDLGPDLQGFSVVDLVMDNIGDRVSTADIKSALVVAGVDSLLSKRLIRSYSRNHVAWCLGPASGPIRQTPSEWTLEMSNLCRLPGQLYGGHYWTDDKGIATEHLYTEYKPIN